MQFQRVQKVTVLKYFTELYQIVNEIINGYDALLNDDSVNCAIGQKRHMDDQMFVYSSRA